MMGFQLINKRMQQIVLQIRANWKDSLSAGAAAGIAWFISQNILGHSHPIFAAMSALMCLAPGLVNHGKQAIYVMVGVLTGVFVGEATLLLPPMPTEVRIALVGFMGLLIGSVYALVPAIIIQAGVSAIMVFAMGAEVAGFKRITDVMVGTGVGLLFSQILFTPDPLKRLRISVERFFHELADNFTLAADALDRRDVAAASRAMKSCARTHAALVSLISAIDTARDSTRWTLRGRIQSRAVTALAIRYDQAGIRLYAITLLFTEALFNAIRKQRDEPPEWLNDAICLVAVNCRFLAGETTGTIDFVRPDRSNRDEGSLVWRDTVAGLIMAENTVARFYKSRTRKSRLQSHRRKQILDAVRAEVEAQKRNRQQQHSPQE